MDLSTRCHEGVTTLGLTLPEGAEEKLLHYLELIGKWNKTYNLTAITDPHDMLIKHIFDSLSVVPRVHGSHVLDVGTGAGLPGMVFAIANPALNVTLLDCIAKKTRFLIQAAHDLDLKNVTVVNDRVQTFAHPRGFDTIVSRAFSSLNEMLEKTDHLLSQGGQMLAMKGVYPSSELDDLPTGYVLDAVHVLTVPHLMAERHVVCLTKEGK